MKAGLQKRGGHGRMEEVRGNDGNEINPLVRGQRSLCPGHGLVTAIDTTGIQKQLFTCDL